ASLNFSRPNPAIRFEDTPFFVNTETREWVGERRIAGVSSFGIGGTNAHVIIEQAPERKAGVAAENDAARSFMLPISARSEGALLALADQHKGILAGGEGCEAGL